MTVAPQVPRYDTWSCKEPRESDGFHARKVWTRIEWCTL